MKKIIVCVSFLLAVNSASAADGRNWKSYYENLLKGLKSKVQDKLESKNRISAVAAVRGAKQGSDANALYWKGGVSEQAQKKLTEDKRKLAEAVQLVVDGNAAEGRSALERFLKENPDSFYAQDAKDALSNLPKEEPVVSPAAGKAEDAAAKQSEAKPDKGN